MYTLHIMDQKGTVTKHDVDTAQEIKAVLSQNKGNFFRLYQRGTTVFHSRVYILKLLKNA